jgi:uncharacterized protein YebE (UPF0316 family)
VENQLFLNPGFYIWFVLPFLIFLARVLDVSFGTIRVIFISKGFKYLSPLIGFFEILIWLLAIGQIMKNLSNPVCYIAYAGGFAMGNYSSDYGITSVDGHGTTGQVKVIFTVVPRKEVKQVANLIKQFNPKAFYTIEEVGFVEKGIFPARKTWVNSGFSKLFRPFRKGK